MGSRPTLDPESMRYDIPCLLCAGSTTETMHSKEPFRIERCTQCQFVFTVPRLSPEQIKQMYQEDYWESDAAKDFGYTDYLADEELYLRTFRMRAAILKKHCPPPATILDVGCAAGFALKVFQELDYDVYGVELSAKMAEEAGKRIGTERVHNGSLEPSLFDSKRFDVITMWDVIEHIEDPIAFLQLAASMLTENGRIVLETQNVSSMFARMMGVRWQHYKFEEHLYHFDPKTMVALLDKAGLELVESSPRRGGKYVSFRFLAERVGRIHPVFSTLCSPLRLLGNRCLYVNVFDEMLVVAKPKQQT